jgi:adhesin HecA-like repeat protein
MVRPEKRPARGAFGLTDGTLDKNGGKVKFTQTGSITLIATAKNSGASR